VPPRPTAAAINKRGFPRIGWQKGASKIETGRRLCEPYGNDNAIAGTHDLFDSADDGKPDGQSEMGVP
jgi:hypothetical protein